MPLPDGCRLTARLDGWMAHVMRRTHLVFREAFILLLSWCGVFVPGSAAGEGNHCLLSLLMMGESRRGLAQS
jgi:hypothetical protein